MVATVARSFLVGIGFDYDQKGAQEIGSSIDGIRSKALQLGAVVTGAFGIKALTTDFAASTDALGKFSEVLGLNADDVAALGRTIVNEGGNFDSLLGQLEQIERLRAGLLVGDADFIAAAGAAGIDTTGLEQATDSFEAFISLADQFRQLSQQQRLNAAEALGLDEASIRLLSKGTDEVERLVEAQRQIRPVTEEAIKASAEFNSELSDLVNNIGGVADQISEQILPPINDALESVNDFFDRNRENIRIGVEGGVDFATDDLPTILKGFFSPGNLLLEGAENLIESSTPAVENIIDRVSGFESPIIISPVDIGPSLGSPLGTAESQLPGTERVINSGPREINVNLNMDGQVIDQRVINVLDQESQTAIDDIATSIRG